MAFNFADLLEQMVDAVPDRLALVCGDQRLSYKELDARATRMAHHLASVGVEPGQHIGVHAYNCAEWVETMFGAFKIRAVPININFRYVEDELRYVYDNADLVALVHHREFGPRIAAVLPDVPSVRHTVVIDDDSGADATGIAYEEALAAAPTERRFPPRSPDDRYVMYTGGTTGLPKGVVWRQEDAFYACLGGGNFGGEPVKRPEELVETGARNNPIVTLVTPPLMHNSGQWVLMSALFGGATAILLDGRSYRAERVWELVDREKGNVISVIGDAMARPLADTLAAAEGKYDTSSLFVIGSGGAILTEAVKQQLHELLPNVMILDSFGASETGYQGRNAEVTGGPRFSVSDVTTVLDDDLRPVEAGSSTVGKVARRGYIPLGYYNDPEKTAETFVDVDGERWALLGDMATVDADGMISLLGRGSGCINTGGEKVFPEEVEAAVRAHPDVFDAVVVGVPDDRWGERVTAVVQTRPGRSVTLEDIQSHCRSRIAGYKLPRAVHVVDQVERHPSGKPDYRWAKAVATGG